MVMLEVFTILSYISRRIKTGRITYLTGNTEVGIKVKELSLSLNRNLISDIFSC